MDLTQTINFQISSLLFNRVPFVILLVIFLTFPYNCTLLNEYNNNDDRRPKNENEC